jgi:hypothetical protein
MAALPAAKTLIATMMVIMDELSFARVAKGNATMIASKNSKSASKPSVEASPPKQVPGASDRNPANIRSLQNSKPTVGISIAAPLMSREQVSPDNYLRHVNASCASGRFGGAFLFHRTRQLSVGSKRS